MSTKLIIGILGLIVVLVSCQPETLEKTSKSDLKNEDKIADLIKEMTINEKIGQLNQVASFWEMTGPAPESIDTMAFYNLIKDGAIGSMLNVIGVSATRKLQQLAVDSSRLGIPLIFGYDVIHGYQTMFPIPLAEAASWNTEAVKLSARIAARETAAAGIHWTFAPMVDIVRDARWGRVMESSGEDTYLSTKMAYARVKGFQGDDLSSDSTIAACAKHFAAYGFVEGGKEYNTVDVGERALHNIILPPFKACVDAGVATFMNSFNILNGIPATADKFLQRNILKGDWNFNGFVVSDWNSIGELIAHGVAANKKEAAKLAITAGSDMDMEGRVYIQALKELVVDGIIDESYIDDAVRRILRIKYQLGLFDDPFKYCNEEHERNEILSNKNLASSRKIARESIVLLKNEGNLLPLSKNGKKIVVVGELAESKDVPLGSWRAQAISNSAISLLEGIQNSVKSSKVLFAKGPDYVINDRSFGSELKFNVADKSGIAKAKSLAVGADVVVIALGEDCFQSGEGRSQTDISLKGLQQNLLDEIHSVNKNVVVVLMNGRPLDISKIAEKVPAIVETWFLGSQAGNAIADVLFGDYNPSGKLPISFPRNVGQLPLYYNHMNTGRPVGGGNSVFWSHYTDEKNDALFPFGYGLSYTSYKYSNLSLSSEKLTFGGEIKISATIKNTGEITGEEVVQLYIRDIVGSVSRPVKELKGFKKIRLAPGQSEEVTFLICPDDLAFYGAKNKWEAEKGEFKVWIGPNSREGLEGGFILN